MKFISTHIDGVYIVEPKIFGDHRGYFMESWSLKAFNENGLNYNFVQDNHSFSAKKGTLRGIHFQKGNFAQAKLVRCTKGAVLDVAVDLRPESLTYKKWISVELSAENFRQLLIPRGFGHAFLTLTDNVEFLYKADNFYSPQNESGICWNDPEIAIDWGITNPILSEKDSKYTLLKDTITDY